MTNLNEYLLESGFMTGMLLLFYVLFLRKEAFHRYNRFYLLSVYIFSFILPLISIGNHGAFTTYSYTVLLPDVSIGNISRSSVMRIHPLKILYLMVSITLFVGFLFNLYKLRRMIVSSNSIRQGPYKVVRHNFNMDSFSFFNIIFIGNSGMTAEESVYILTHEQAHARGFHSIDVLFSQVICILFWFNPFVWLVRKYMFENHEYMADSCVLESGCTKTEYLQLIYNQGVIKTGFAPVNNFNQSLIKRRIAMISKVSSSKFSILKRYMIFPVIVMLFLVVACNRNDSRTDAINVADQSPPAELSSDLSKMPDSLGIFDQVEEAPEFPGGFNALVSYVKEQVKYPESARLLGTQGTVKVSFVVEKDGAVASTKVMEGVSDELDREALRVIESMPAWEPGRNDGKEVRVRLILPVQFKLN